MAAQLNVVRFFSRSKHVYFINGLFFILGHLIFDRTLNTNSSAIDFYYVMAKWTTAKHIPTITPLKWTELYQPVFKIAYSLHSSYRTLLHWITTHFNYKTICKPHCPSHITVSNKRFISYRKSFKIKRVTSHPTAI